MQAKWAIPTMSIIEILRRGCHVSVGHPWSLWPPCQPGPHLTSGKLPPQGFSHFLFSLPRTLFPGVCLTFPQLLRSAHTSPSQLGLFLTILFKTTTSPTPHSLSFPEFFSVAPSTAWYVFSSSSSYFFCLYSVFPIGI